MATMYVYNIPTNETVNLRKTASGSATIVDRVPYGKAVQASYYNSDWHSASYNGKSGYIMSKYLTTTDPNGGGGNTGASGGSAGASDEQTMYVYNIPTNETVNLRKTASGSATIVDRVPYGKAVQASYYNSDWYSASYNGKSGYIMSKYLTTTDPNGGGGNTGASDEQTMYVYNIPTNETVNLRETASGSATIVDRVPYGKAVQASYYNSDWHSASYNGKSGYIMSKYLTTTDPNGGSGNTSTETGTPTAGVIKGTSVRVREEPNTTSTILANVNTGDKVTYYAGESYSGSGYNWYRCTSSRWSDDGYITTNYVVKDDGSASSGNGDYSIPATVDTSKHGNGGTVNLRSKPWKSSDNITSIGNGKAIYVKNKTGTWLPAKFGTKTGYIMAKFVKDSTAYNMTGSETSGSGEYGLFYTGNRRLTSSEKKVNAQYILDYLRDQGWTKNAVCGMLGNMEVESFLSPGTWQNLKADVDKSGFGLTQWSPATKYFGWACDEGYLYDHIDVQLKRILYEVANPKLQWSRSKCGMSFSDFTHSTNTAADLATTFCKGYEKPSAPDYTTRKANATSWYNQLT